MNRFYGFVREPTNEKLDRQSPGEREAPASEISPRRHLKSILSRLSRTVVWNSILAYFSRANFSTSTFAVKSRSDNYCLAGGLKLSNCLLRLIESWTFLTEQLLLFARTWMWHACTMCCLVSIKMDVKAGVEIKQFRASGRMQECYLSKGIVRVLWMQRVRVTENFHNCSRRAT